MLTIYNYITILENGLEFFFDVKTSLNVSDVSFFPSQRSHTYDLYASAVDKEDVLFVDLESGKLIIAYRSFYRFNKGDINIYEPQSYAFLELI